MEIGSGARIVVGSLGATLDHIESVDRAASGLAIDPHSSESFRFGRYTPEVIAIGTRVTSTVMLGSLLITADARASAEPSAARDDATSTRRAAAMKGRWGIGALRTVSGLNSLYGRFYLADRLTLGLATGFVTFSHRETDDSGELARVRTVGTVAIGPELFVWPVQGPRNQQVHADLGFGTRVITYVGFLGLPEEEQSSTLDTPVEIDIEIPIKLQLFIGRRVSVNPEFGAVVRIIPGSRAADPNGDVDQNPGTGIGSRLGTTDGPGLGFELGNHAGLFMGIGVGYYFGRLRG